MKKIAITLLALVSMVPAAAQVIVGPNRQYSWQVPSTAIPGQQGSYIALIGQRGPIPSTYSLQFVVSGTAPSVCTFSLEGSNDAATWVGLDAGGVNCTASGIEYISNKPVSFLRVNLASFTSGDSTTVVRFNYTGSTSTGFPSTVPAAIASGGTGATTPTGALASLGAATSIRSLPACTGSNIPCMVYASGQSAAIGATTVTLPSVINGVTCTTTPSSCVVKLTAVIHTTAVFTGTSPTVSVSLGPYNGFSTFTSATLDLTNILRTISSTTSFIADVSAQQKFIYSTTFAGTPVGGTYELLILVE